MADVYARTFRTQILSVWEDTVARINELDTGGGKWFNDDLKDVDTTEHKSAHSESVVPALTGKAEPAEEKSSTARVAERWSDKLQESGVKGPVQVNVEETLFPPLVRNRSTDRIHWGSRETIDAPVTGTMCNTWKIAGLAALHTFASPEEFFEYKVIWCRDTPIPIPALLSSTFR